MRRKQAISKQIISAIRQSGLSAAEIERLAGVSRSVITRFINGERTITLATADALCAALGVSVKVEAKED